MQPRRRPLFAWRALCVCCCVPELRPACGRKRTAPWSLHLHKTARTKRAVQILRGRLCAGGRPVTGRGQGSCRSRPIPTWRLGCSKRLHTVKRVRCISRQSPGTSIALCVGLPLRLLNSLGPSRHAYLAPCHSLLLGPMALLCRSARTASPIYRPKVRPLLPFSPYPVQTANSNTPRLPSRTPTRTPSLFAPVEAGRTLAGYFRGTNGAATCGLKCASRNQADRPG